MNITLVSVGGDWISAARLPKPLKAAGFTVNVCCPPDCLLTRSAFIDRRAAITPPVTRDALWLALCEIHRHWGIGLAVPCDESSVNHLRRFVRDEAGHRDDHDRAVAAALAASLGNRDMHASIVRKSYLATAPRVEGCRLPPQSLIDHTVNVFAAARELGYPVMLKRDFMAGGNGVYGIADAAALEAFVAANNVFMRHAPGDARLHPGYDGIVQKRIAGTPASVTLAAHEGRLLDAFAYRRVAGHPAETGPTSVAERLDRPDLVAAAAALTAHFGFTGLGGVDFILEEGTGRPWLLEFNARPPVSAHLGRLFGADLCAALHAALAGTAPPPPPPPQASLVAMFPLEWRRDRTSGYLSTAHHDVPWDDVPLLKAIVERMSTA